MPDVWPTLTAAKLGIPVYPAGFELPDYSGIHASWVRGVRVDVADWYWFQPRFDEVRDYLNIGGDPNKIILNHMTYDDGFISGLWTTGGFEKRVLKMKGYGIKNVLSPDFSTWGEWPVAVHIYNIYRSAVLATDFLLAGFNVIPLVTWTLPQTLEIQMSRWPKDIRWFGVDMQHYYSKVQDNEYNHQLFFQGARRAVEEFPKATTLLYHTSKRALPEYRSVTSKVVPVPSRSVALNGLQRAQKQVANGAVQEIRSM